MIREAIDRILDLAGPTTIELLDGLSFSKAPLHLVAPPAQTPIGVCTLRRSSPRLPMRGAGAATT